MAIRRCLHGVDLTLALALADSVVAIFNGQVMQPKPSPATLIQASEMLQLPMSFGKWSE